MEWNGNVHADVMSKDQALRSKQERREAENVAAS
jgi:hypothetical protein